MTEETRDLMLYRLQRADETLAEARLLAEGGFWNAVANRLYYACFYALIAAFLKTEESSPKTHAGVKSLFNLKFVKTGLVSPQMGVFYGKIFQKRQDSDYRDLEIFLEEQTKPLIGETEEFIKIIRTLIDQ